MNSGVGAFVEVHRCGRPDGIERGILAQGHLLLQGSLQGVEVVRIGVPEVQ